MLSLSLLLVTSCICALLSYAKSKMDQPRAYVTCAEEELPWHFWVLLGT